MALKLILPGVLVVLLGFAALVMFSSKPSASAPPSEEEAPTQQYSALERAAAAEVMVKIREQATLADSGSTLDVTFQDFILTADFRTRSRLVNAVAGADMVIRGGRTRLIRFNASDGTPIAQVDSAGGVQLFD